MRTIPRSRASVRACARAYPAGTGANPALLQSPASCPGITASCVLIEHATMCAGGACWRG